MKMYLTTNYISRNTAGTRCAARRCGFTPLEILIKGKADTHYAFFLTGFTIVELLMVVAIITLVAGLGGGLYVGTYKKMLVEKVARNFLLTAKYARIMAIERQQPYEIQLDVANGGFWLATSQWSEDTEQTEQVIVRDYYCKPVQFEGEVKFEDIQVTPIGEETSTENEENQSIVFSPYGTAQSAMIQIGDGKNHYTISICTATGKAKIYFGTAENIEVGTIDLDAE